MHQSTQELLHCHEQKAEEGIFLYLKEHYRGQALIPLHSRKANGSCTCQNKSCTSIAKHPRTRNGLKDASAEAEQINSWWSSFPGSNVGLLTGRASGIVVLDIDLKSGGLNSLRKLQEDYDQFPQTSCVRTGGGGLHYYFKAPEFPLKNRTNLLPGIDFRADGGYVVAPPSLHASGYLYEWETRCENSFMPAWLLELVKPQHKTISKPESKVKEGQRNSTLTSIGGFLLSRGVSSDALPEILSTVNKSSLSPSLSAIEVEKVSKSLKRYDSEVWNDPIPLKSKKRELLSLKEDMIPKAFRNWVVESSERMSVPLEFIAAPLIVSVASLLGRRARIMPHKFDTWTVVPNLWGFLIAEPGSLKSPALSLAMKPLEKIEAKARKVFEQEHEKQVKEERQVRGEIDALKAGLKLDIKEDFLDALAQKQSRIQELEEVLGQDKKIKEKRYRTNDPTVEKLALILKDNPKGILLLRDELSGWLSSLGQKGREGNREFYLETWNGDSSFIVDRIARGSIYIEALCLSIFGSIQPAKLRQYIEKHTSLLGDDGFLERFQIVLYPEQTQKFELATTKQSSHSFEKIASCFDFLDSLDFMKALVFDGKAQSIMDDWRLEHEKRLSYMTSSPLIKGHLSKYRSLIPSLALVFSFIDSSSEQKTPEIVREESLRLALEWAKVLESHLLKVYESTIHDRSYSAEFLAEKIQSFQIADGDKLRAVSRRQWKGLTTSSQIKGAIDELSKLNWVRRETVSGNGGRSEVIRINPKLPLGGWGGVQ